MKKEFEKRFEKKFEEREIGSQLKIAEESDVALKSTKTCKDTPQGGAEVSREENEVEEETMTKTRDVVEGDVIGAEVQVGKVVGR